MEEGGGDEKKSPRTDVDDPSDELALKKQAMDAESFLSAFDSFSCVLCKANSVIVELIFRCLFVAYYCFEVWLRLGDRWRRKMVTTGAFVTKYVCAFAVNAVKVKSGL